MISLVAALAYAQRVFGETTTKRSRFPLWGKLLNFLFFEFFLCRTYTPQYSGSYLPRVSGSIITAAVAPIIKQSHPVANKMFWVAGML